MVTVAAAQYPIDRLPSWEAYAAKLTQWVESAVAGGAGLLVFPEYGAMELASLDPATMGDLAACLQTVSDLLPRVDALHAELAARHGVHILAASAPCAIGDGRYVNRARLFGPEGPVGHQDKQIMTRFENEHWHISPGQGVQVFETAIGRIGVAICYDSEFPLLVRAMVEAGAQIILVPSCTDSLHGYWRVRLGAQARALEGQCYVVHSPTIGTAEWSPAVDENHGAAAIYGPPDGAFPPDGVVAIGELDAPQWVFGEADLDRIAAVRADGRVLNLRDWAKQKVASAFIYH
jgi:predicted amidohydrolase